MNFPAELKYTADHEWVRIEGDIAFIGITDYAQSELGEIVYVDVETVGDTVDANAVFGSIEAVKTVSDLMMPLTGEVLELNEELEEAPQLVNEDPYGKGWIIKVAIANPSEVDALMDAATYESKVNA